MGLSTPSAGANSGPSQVHSWPVVPPYTPNVRRLLIGTAVLTTLGGAGLWWFAWPIIAPPYFTCSLPDPSPCEPTGDGSTTWFDLNGRPTAIDVRPAPERWKTSDDPGFRSAQWAARVDRFLQGPIVAACYYSSDGLVSCHAQEQPFNPD